MIANLSKLSDSRIARYFATVCAVAALLVAMGGTWARNASAAPAAVQSMPVTKPADVPSHASDDASAKKSGRKQLTGKLNLNTASEEQLQLLPTVGPAKAERIIAWRKKNGAFKRTVDIRHIKGFGYKTFKKLEPYLDIKGETTLAAN